MFRPDLVDVWVFRVPIGPRAGRDPAHAPVAGRILAGLWQGVSGSLEDGERVVVGALRELREETGFADETIEAFYDLDQVNQFHEPSRRDPQRGGLCRPGRADRRARPVRRARHRSLGDPEPSRRLIVWPAYRESIAVIERDLLDPGRAAMVPAVPARAA